MYINTFFVPHFNSNKVLIHDIEFIPCSIALLINVFLIEWIAWKCTFYAVFSLQ